MIEGIPTNIISETISVDGGRIEFTFYDTNGSPICNFILTDVKQVKGKGTADADRLKFLSPKHVLVLQLLLKDGESEYTAKEMKDLIEIDFKVKGEQCDPNHYNRVISELLRKDCFVLEGIKYNLNMEKINNYLKTGSFENE